MSYLDKLLEGVEVNWKTLGEMAVIGTGSSNRQDEIENGEYPFYVRSQNVLRSNLFQFDETAIIIPGEGGIGDIFHFVQGKYALHQRAYRINITSTDLDPKFMYYYMHCSFKSYIITKSVGATAISIRKPMLEGFLIPIPPLAVQQEIVRILDTFNALTAELTAELTVRKKQYEFYREQLFTFEEGQVEWKALGEVVSKMYSGSTPSAGNSRFYYNGTIPWLRTQEVKFIDIQDTEIKITEIAVKETSTKWIPTNCVIIAISGATAGRSAVNKIPLTTNQHCLCLEVNPSIVLYRYVFYWISYNYINIKNLGQGARGDLNSGMIKKFKIPVPSIAEQERIVSILDKFDTLTTSLSEGLPKEIELRKKQYEYYRDRLLTFPREQN